MTKISLNRLGVFFACGVAVAISLPTLSLWGQEFAPDAQRIFKTPGDSELKLHLFYPDDRVPSAARPAIVFFFGGGWNSGSPSQFFPQCEYFASRGMVAISAEYRVASRHRTTPRECVEDGKSAIRWIRQHATELGIDPGRLAAGGGSAGGQVAAATGTVAGFEAEGENLGISARPDALVLFNPVLDNGPGGYGHERVLEYWEDFSPLHNIDSSMPPTVVLSGEEDRLISPATLEKFRRRAELAGVRCEVEIYPGQPHGFFNFRNRASFVETVRDADRFLESIGFLDGEENVSEFMKRFSGGKQQTHRPRPDVGERPDHHEG